MIVAHFLFRYRLLTFLIAPLYGRVNHLVSRVACNKALIRADVHPLEKNRGGELTLEVLPLLLPLPR
jgi:hypothetical protein